MSCGDCSELARAQRRIRDLEHQVAQMERRIRRLQQIIESARAAAAWWLARAQQVLSRRSGVPFGRWAFMLGAYYAASTIYRLLESES